ncbi:MAG: hypothetical protein ACU0BF_08890 [Paracoccaceae bacterium]
MIPFTILLAMVGLAASATVALDYGTAEADEASDDASPWDDTVRMVPLDQVVGAVPDMAAMPQMAAFEAAPAVEPVAPAAPAIDWPEEFGDGDVALIRASLGDLIVDAEPEPDAESRLTLSHDEAADETVLALDGEGLLTFEGDATAMRIGVMAATAVLARATVFDLRGHIVDASEFDLILQDRA